MQNPTGLDILLDDVQQYGTEGEIDGTNDDENEEGRPIFSPPTLDLTVNLVELQKVPWNAENYGIEQYKLNLEVIERNSEN